MNRFLVSVLDSITEHIVVIDEAGAIHYVNKSWVAFGEENACVTGDRWGGVNYLEECDKAASTGDEFGETAGKGIRSVINGKQQEFYFEYPCHSPQEKRWFMMRAKSFEDAGKRYFVISHQNITERKQAEEEVRNLANIDGLTGVSNRRGLDAFIDKECRRCARQQKTVSLALVDADHFKLLNDTYGHLRGDECLQQLARLLRGFVKRPGDICARYGGEEFALFWSDTSLLQSRQLCNDFMQQVIALKIPNDHSPTEPFVTVSIGLVAMVPEGDGAREKLVREADSLLYQAKNNGRNRLEY